MRHVSPTFLDSTLRRGASLEQFLGSINAEAERLVRWIGIRPAKDCLELWQFIAPDLGDEEHLDLYDFLAAEADEGAGIPEELIGTFDTAEDAFSCAGELGAQPNRWVNQFVLQEEYLDFIRAGRPPQWPGVVV
jgi:hypothetical protein